jgi:hypothetical protein
MATTDKQDTDISERAKHLKGTPYELGYISKPTPTTTKYVFQHTVAISYAEAVGVIAEADLHLRQGTAEWSSGERYAPEVTGIAAAIRQRYPSASWYSVTSSDQGDSGYLLTGVGFDDSTVITYDSDSFARLAERIDDDYTRALPWGVFGDRDEDSSFDVDLDTGRILRR